MQISYVKGNSVMVDMTFQSYYTHLGYWLEIMVPLYNVLMEGEWLKHIRVGDGWRLTGLQRVMFQALTKHLYMQLI